MPEEIIVFQSESAKKKTEPERKRPWFRLIGQKSWHQLIRAKAKTQVKAKPKTKKRFDIKKIVAFTALAVMILLVSPYLFIELKYHWGELAKKEETSGFSAVIKRIEEDTGFGRIIRESDLEILQPEDPNFSVVIPKINVNNRIIANVPTEDEKQYNEALKQGVAQASGSYLPPDHKTVFLFGHSTDYIWNVKRFNAVFYLLKELEAGDRISVFYQSNRYEYEVTESKVVKPTELELVNNELDKDRLILQTCWPPGTTWKRLLVFAKPV